MAHDYMQEKLAWKLVDLMTTLADKLEADRLDDETFEAVSDLQDEVYTWASETLSEGLTQDAVHDACEAVWMGLAYHQ